jgi:hypothetical protein
VHIHRNTEYSNDPNNTHHAIVAVDPSGGGNSAFAVASIAFTPLGRIVAHHRVAEVANFPGALRATSLREPSSVRRRRLEFGNCLPRTAVR